MLRLEIDQQQGKIALQIKPPVIQLFTAPAKLNLETEAATLEISQSKGKLEIDGTPFRYSIGIKNMADFTRDFAQDGQVTALEAIGRIAADGDRMAAIEIDQNPIAELSASANYPETPSITWANTAPPDITYISSPPEFAYTEGSISYDNKPSVLNLKLDWGKVDISMAQYPRITFSVVGSQVNLNV